MTPRDPVRALREFGADVPDLPPVRLDALAIERRAAALRARRAGTLSGTACAIVTAVALVAGMQAGPGMSSLSVDPTATPSAGPTGEPEPAPAASASPQPVAGTPDAVPAPVPADPVTAELAPPPYDGPRRFEAEADGYRVEVDVSDVEVAAAELVTLDVRWQVPDGVTDVDAVVTLGDGRWEASWPRTSACGANGFRQTAIAYRSPQPAAYRLHIGLMWYDPCPDGPREFSSFGGEVGPVLTFEILVAGGPSTSNGPVRPVADLEVHTRPVSVTPVVGPDVWVDVWVSDLDGELSWIEIDYGDGRPASRQDFHPGCEGSPTEWPRTSWVPTFTSRRYLPGTYTLTVTVATVGCDGENEQRTTTRRTVTVP